MIQSPTGRSGREGTTHAFWLQPTSPTGALGPVASLPPDGLIDRKAWPKAPLLTLTPHSLTGDTPSPCSLLFSNGHDQSRLGSTDRGCPLDRDQETCGENQGEAHKSNHGTRDHTLHGTVLCNRPDTNSVVGAYIYPYSIMCAIKLPYGKAPPACLWASIVLWAPGFTIPSAHGETSHIPLGINSVCRYRHLPYLDKDNGTSYVHLTSNSVVGVYHHPVPIGVGNKARSIRTLSLSLVRPSPSSIKGDALPPT